MTNQNDFDEHSPPFGGFLTPMMTVIGGAGVYFLMFRFFVDPMHGDVLPTDPSSYKFLWEVAPALDPAGILAVDLSARYAIALPSLMLTMAALASFVAAITLVLRSFGLPAQILGGLGGLAGAGVGYLEQYNNPIRGLVADCPPRTPDPSCPLDQAALRADAPGGFDAGMLEQMRLLIDWNSAISVAACCVLGVCFLSIARQAPEDQLTPAALRQRRKALSVTLSMAALVLVLSITTTHGFYHYAAALIAGKQGVTIGALGSTGAAYWGAVYATVFVVIALPALFGLHRDIQRAAATATAQGSYAERNRWCREHGLTMRVLEALVPVLMALVPILTSPFLDALAPFLAGGGN